MSTSYERTFRADLLKRYLAETAGRALELGTPEAEDLAFRAGVLANELLLPDYDSDEALDAAERQYREMEAELARMQGDAW